MKIRASKTKTISQVLAITVVALSCFAFSQEEQQEQSKQLLLTVSTESLSELVFYPTRSAPATALSLNNSRIPAEISAVIRSIPVRVGDIVAAGDLLAELDCRQTQLSYSVEAARLSQFTTALELEKRELKRRETLVAGGNIGESVFDRSKTEVLNKEQQLLAQQAAFNIAELNVQRCSIIAPYAGVVSARLASEGENLALGKAVVQLVQLGELEVMANIALGDVDSFQAAEAYSFQENGDSYGLNIRSLLPVIETNSRIREARFVFSNEQALSGTSGRLVWESPLGHVPARFLQLRDNGLGVFIAENDKARFIVLDDAEEGRPVPFDMSDATMLITDGRFGLVDGQAINIR